MEELKLVQTMYDRIYDIVTYSPGGKKPVFDARTTLVQLVPLGQPIAPKDYLNAVTPTNINGDYTASEAFARLVDAVPAVSADYKPTTVGVDRTYGSIVQYANTDEEPSAEQLAIYKQAFGFLNQTLTVKSWDGKETTQIVDTPIFAAYKANQLGYLTALSGYRNAYNNYNLTDSTQQRQWQANAPMLQAAVDNTWNTWRSQGASQVEDGLAALNHSANQAVRRILQADQDAYAQSALTSNLGIGAPWHLSYGLPNGWYDPACPGFTNMTISTSYLNTSSESKFTQYGGGGSYGAGLWSVGSSFNHTEKEQRSHSDATKVQISLDLGVVQLFRPWLDGQVFNMGGWNMGKAYAKGGISSGVLKENDNHTMPLVPVGFVVARNISIAGDWGSTDKSHVEQATSASASVGWGPFQISGSYNSSRSQDTFASKMENGVIKVPGVQIIAWINQVVPLCPPA